MRILALILLSFVGAIAGVVKDLPTSFVYADSVRDFAGGECSDGIQVIPENTVLKDGMPYRVYSIAVPSNSKPLVSVKDISLQPVGKLCSSDAVKFRSAFATSPILRDGLWISSVWVPVLKGSSNSASVRKSFELSVTFSGKAIGFRPGKRALSRVINTGAASRFGTESYARALRKSASDLFSTEWLAQFVVGDKEIAGHSENGLYGVSYKDIQTAMNAVGGASTLDGIRIKDLRLFGASADTLPDVLSSSTAMLPNHLREIPMDVVDKNGNNIFDSGDSLYFVGYGTALWKRFDLEDKTYASSPMEYYFSNSPYSFYQYFQLGVLSTGEPLRLSSKLQARSGGTVIKPLRYVRAEKDLLLRDTFFGRAETGTWETSSGKEWFWAWNVPNGTTTLNPGELAFSSTTTLDGFVDKGASYIAVTFMPHRSTSSSDMGEGIIQVSDLELSGKSYVERMAGINFSATVNGTVVKDFELSAAGNFVSKISNLKKTGNSYQLSIMPGGMNFDRFDGYSVAYEWNPQTDSSDWILPGKKSGLIKVPVQAKREVMKFENGVPVGLLPVKDGYAVDSVSLSSDVRYMMYNPEKVNSLKVSAMQPRRNGTLARPEKISSNTEYLIIAPEAFQKQALDLANFRSSSEVAFPLATTLVLSEDIYRLYTGGSISPIALRDYIAYARSICPDLRYVLMAGAAHFDYREKKAGIQTLRLPPFEKEDAVVEDFFAVLDSGESVRFGDYDLDLSVGRLPVNSTVEFENYNEKAFAHEKRSIMDNGKWRSTILLAADDAINSSKIDPQQHTTYIEGLSSLIDSVSRSKNKKWYQNKIYLLDYEADASDQKPEAALDLQDAVNQGTLFTIYFGHGNLTDWASEGLLKPSFLTKFNNDGLYTILASFSCSLGRFDMGDEHSLSEQFVQTAGRGSIISIGASRESYGSRNTRLAKNFMYHALGDSAVRIGDAFIRGKGLAFSSYSIDRYNNERYVILGEPVISMPVEKAKITFDTEIDSIQALDKMKISGSVDGVNNGKIYVSLQEGPRSKYLSYEPASSDSVLVRYEGSLIYSEVANVKNGKFALEFITPRKITFGDSTAEISAYVYSNENPFVGRYLKSDLLISGMSSYADSIHDKVPPEIKITTCSQGSSSPFADNQKVVLETPACLQVTVEDSTAIDYSTDADEGISFEVLDVTSPFHPYPYVEQSARKAVAKMTFSENSYPAGTYSFRVRAQDILGNVSVKTVQVEITEKLKAGLADVFNAPNPMGKKGTTFYFKDLAVGRNASVSILIYNQNGRLVNRLDNVKSGITTWNGKDFYNRTLANGLYHYVVKSEVPATETSKKKTFTKKQKLIISR